MSNNNISLGSYKVWMQYLHPFYHKCILAFYVARFIFQKSKLYYKTCLRII